MSASARFLNPSEAARQLGVSAKALRLYEQRGLIAPARTAAGWRAYGPAQMARAAQIASLRALGLSLAQTARALEGGLAPILAAHQTSLEQRVRQLAGAAEAVRGLRAGLEPLIGPDLAFDLPWPWDGERFELRRIRPLTHIVGPLGSGKTRLLLRLAECLPGAVFLSMDRSADALAVALKAKRPAPLVVDMLEHGLDQAGQAALIAHLRHRGSNARPLVFTTRSNAILDLQAVGADETIILCPANHSPPVEVAPHPGSPGYEALASCLASPVVRARTAGVIAWRPGAA